MVVSRLLLFWDAVPYSFVEAYQQLKKTAVCSIRVED
jgi:hypothetical protein